MKPATPAIDVMRLGAAISPENGEAVGFTATERALINALVSSIVRELHAVQDRAA